MLTRRMASVILLIGGCTKKEEGGALRSIEELSFRENSDGIDVKSRVVGELQEPRRSPAVFAEKDGFLVVGGCQEKGVHARSAERLLWSRDSLVSNGSFFHDVVEATSCAASFKLDDWTMFVADQLCCFRRLHHPSVMIGAKIDPHLKILHILSYPSEQYVRSYSESNTQDSSYRWERDPIFQHSTGVVVGGFNGQDCLRNVQLIKMNEDEVSSGSLADTPFRLKNSVAVKISDSEALLFGGWDEHRTVKGVFRMCFDDCNTSYHMKMDSILPHEVEGHCCALHNGYVYIIGGYDGISVTDTIVRYSIFDKSSEVLPTRLSIARENHVCEVIFDRYVVVMAGWDGRQALDSVEIFKIIEESPYLIPTGIELSLCQRRNRPASVSIDL